MASDDEQVLSGGNVTPVVRIGDTVRRETGPWTDAVHALLRQCEDAGIPGTPRVHGIDGAGREILSFVAGDVLADAAPDILWSRAALRDAARLLRRIHDASIPLAARELTWRAPAHEPVEVVCHNDFAPYNLVVRGRGVSGAFDFDFASPGPRLWDVAYLAYRLAPYAEDAEGVDPVRHGAPAHRVRLLVEEYGAEWSVGEVSAAAADRLDELAGFTDARAAATGRADLVAHADMYRRDAERLRGGGAAHP